MAVIRILDNALSNMIAAGEVIERQSSVVKELVENSLDAKARNIVITLTEAGRSKIEITDDGDGMDKEDALTSLKRHATSKISSPRDLFRIKTLGFRGEALPSIASVSGIEIITSTGHGQGSHIISQGEEITVSPSSLRKGTTVIVKDLFYNTPARLKYLKADYIENANTIETVTKIALAYPEVSLKLVIDGRVALFTTGHNDMLETIYRLYGAETAGKVVKVNYDRNDFKIEGYIGLPEIAKSNRYYITTILNKRSVYMARVQSAVIEAYKDFLPPVRFPFVILNISIDSQLVDVNVHPSKKEVRLSKENELIDVLLENIPLSLRKQSLIPEVGFRKEIPADAVMPPLSSYEKETAGEATLDLFSPDAGTDVLYQAKTKDGGFKKLYAKGQIRATYIIAEDETLDGFYLVDQHAADERINYEKNLALMKEDRHITTPLISMILHLKPSEMSLLDDEKTRMLSKLGLNIEPIGPSAIRVITLPLWAKNYGEQEYCESLIGQVLHEVNPSPEQLYDDAIATKSCRASIKANETLTLTEMQHLLDELGKCDNPYACPHGRPTIIHFTNYEIEKLFKRTGF